MASIDFSKRSLEHSRWLGLRVEPVVVAAERDAQTPTQSGNAVAMAGFINEGVLHGSCLAKYAAAFFKMSRSSVTRASSRLSCSISGCWASSFLPGPLNAACVLPALTSSSEAHL